MTEHANYLVNASCGNRKKSTIPFLQKPFSLNYLANATCGNGKKSKKMAKKRPFSLNYLVIAPCGSCEKRPPRKVLPEIWETVMSGYAFAQAFLLRFV